MEDDLIEKKYREAYEFFRKNDLDQAYLTLKELAKDDSAHLNAREYLGIVLLEMECYQEAISVLSSVLKETSPKFRYLENVFGYADNDNKKDIVNEKEVVNEHTAWTYYHLGMAYLVKGEYSEAVKCLRGALKTSKKDRNIFRNDLGWIYYKWDKFGPAMKQYKKALNNISKGEESDTGHTHLFYGLALYKKGKPREAQEQLEKALDRFKDQARQELHKDDVPNRNFYHLMKASAYNNLGRIKMDDGDYQKAKELFRKGLRICEREESKKHIDQLTPRQRRKEKNTIAALHNNLGLVYFKQGYLDEAKKEYEAALKSEELPETYNNLAVISNNEGAKEKAENYLKNALRMDNNFKVANTNLKLLREKYTSWLDWWFKHGLLRVIVGFVLVMTLVFMMANMVATSFSGWELPLDINESAENTETKTTREPSAENTETKTTREPSLESKVLLTALIIFLLLHPQIKGFSIGGATFEMETASPSESGSLSCVWVTSN